MREWDGSFIERAAAMSFPDPWGLEPGPWHAVERRSRARGQLVAAMLAHREPLLEWYPRVPVPSDDVTLYTPVAALLLVWEHWNFAHGSCPRCGAPAVAIAFGGLLNTGSVSGCCAGCGQVVNRRGGGFPWVVRCCELATAGTPYRIPFRKFPGGWHLAGEPQALVAALQEVGARELPHLHPGALGEYEKTSL